VQLRGGPTNRKQVSAPEVAAARHDLLAAVRALRTPGAARRGPTPTASPYQRTVFVLGRHHRVAFVARQDTDARWRWLITRDDVAAGRGAACLLERVPHLRLRLPVLG
jgi:hypothetical protein